MDPDLLRAFVAVAETRGFGAAARRLNRTQAAVSLQIQRLEAQAGARLFNRTSRNVALTEAGQTLLAYARRLLRLEEEARAAVGDAADPIRLRLGLSDEQAAAYLPAVLPRLRAAYPTVQLAVTCALSTALVEQFDDGLLDAVLAIRHPTGRTGRLIGLEQLAWIAGDGFTPAVGRPVPLAVNPDGCAHRARGLAALGRIGRQWRIAFASQSATGINLAVASGMGVGIKAVRAIPDGCRALTEDDGLPPLPPVEIDWHTRLDRFGTVGADLETWLLAAVADSPSVQMLEAWETAPAPEN